MIAYESNVYYNPEKWNLKLIGEIEYSDLEYQFDTRIFLSDDENKRIYTARDSGCSCPTPFEDINSLNDLAEIKDISWVRGEISEELNKYENSVTSLDEAQDLLRTIEKLLNEFSTS